MTAQFVIGIDLGTTNSVLAYSPLDDESPQVFVLPIPQLVAPQTVESLPMLPSFLYLGTEAELAADAFRLPWDNAGAPGAEPAQVDVSRHSRAGGNPASAQESRLDSRLRGNDDRARAIAVGQFARSLAAEFPERTIGGAKSWLAHSRVDRHHAILPWQAPAEVPKQSPVAVAQRYLEHLVDAWHQAWPDVPLAQQQVVLTVPASFDASARELTREAAIKAGLPESLILLEEPQAATYAWLSDAGNRWRKQLTIGDRLLVCDIGGGTTDLTLVEVAEEGGELVLHRAAVGNHLLVGGDNMDLALAHFVAGLFEEQGVTLDPWQSVSLWHSCRNAKEQLLSPNGPEQQTISVPGRGRRLVGGLVSVTVDRQRATELLLDGFLPPTQLTDRPARTRASGFRELGLPFEPETGITKHLAAFLNQSLNGKPLTHVLFNGGVFKAAALRQRMLEQLHAWFPDRTPQPVEGADDLDFSVARGACYYGWMKLRGGVRIRGGTARAYYVGIETAGLAIPGAGRPLKALCVVPHGMEEGTQLDVPSDPIGLVVGEAARFRFFSSASRRDDRPGGLLSRWSPDELQETDSLEATLPAVDGIEDDYVPVTIQSRITELGVLELWCVSDQSPAIPPADRSWKLEFSVRDDAEV